MLLPKQELEDMAKLHPEIAEYVKDRPRPTPSRDIPAMRKMMAAMDSAANVRPGEPFTGSETYPDIEMRDGYKSSLKIQRPADGAEPGPLIVLAFGGGFVGGDNTQFTKLGRVLVNTFGTTVVSISYRLAPEYKFPYSQHDALDSMKWIASNATGSVLHSDPTKGFLMGGVSAGGAITACLSRLFQDEPLAHPLTGQWLCIPSIMDGSNVPEKYKEYWLSTEQQANNPFFSAETRKWLTGLVEWDVSSPLRCAINATSPLEGQPKTYFQICGADPLRDDALIYDEMLSTAGVETKVDLYPGCPHGHFSVFPRLEIGKKANIDTVVGFGWLLGKEISREQAAKELRL